jgi:hypothetical protein
MLVRIGSDVEKLSAEKAQQAQHPFGPWCTRLCPESLMTPHLVVCCAYLHGQLSTWSCTTMILTYRQANRIVPSDDRSQTISYRHGLRDPHSYSNYWKNQNEKLTRSIGGQWHWTYDWK